MPRDGGRPLAPDAIAVELGKLTTGGYASTKEGADAIVKKVDEATTERAAGLRELASPYGAGVATVGVPTVCNSSSVTTPTWRSRPR